MAPVHCSLSAWVNICSQGIALVKGPWTDEEDTKVLDLVRNYGAKRWSLIASHLPGRIGKQCRERWHNHLNPHISKAAWTDLEDRTILEAHQKLGNRWAEIAKVRRAEAEAGVQPGPRCISLLAYSPLLCLTAPHAFFDPLYLTACPLPANRRCCRAARTTPSRTTGTRP